MSDEFERALGDRLQRYGETVDRAIADASAVAATRPRRAAAVRPSPWRAIAVVGSVGAAALAVTAGVLVMTGDDDPGRRFGSPGAEQVVATDGDRTIGSEPPTTPSTTAVTTTTTSTVTTTVVTTTVAPTQQPAPPTGEPQGPPSNDDGCERYEPNDRFSIGFCDQGRAVVEIQRRLRASVAPDLVIDGYFGPYTLAAVEEFQRSVGLDDDGWVGPDTWSALVPDAPGTDANGNGLVDPWELA